MLKPYALIAALILSMGLLTACQALDSAGVADDAPANGRNEVIILGMVHQGHVTSPDYSIERLRITVNAIDPDVILTELPTFSYQQALTSFAQTGSVGQNRATAFPEYTQAIIPMAATHRYQIIGTSAWTPQIARARAATLEAIRNDPDRADQWQAWTEAQTVFTHSIKGRGNNPKYIHSAPYDAAVKARYAPYQRYFDADLGAGGWGAINDAHIANINRELDALTGQNKRVLITFGAFHKYQLLEKLATRDDIIIRDTQRYFQ